jgi:hypothetical protein
MDYIRKQTLEPWTPGILGPSLQLNWRRNKLIMADI